MKKFQNGLAEDLWYYSLDSGQDDMIGSCEELGWYALFTDTGEESLNVILKEDSLGFVTVQVFESEDDAKDRWAEILAEYAKYDSDIMAAMDVLADEGGPSYDD